MFTIAKALDDGNPFAYLLMFLILYPPIVIIINDGYTPFGYIVDYDNKRFFFDLDGNHVKTKAN